MNITIPANTNATLFIPAASPEDITESGNTLSKLTGITLGSKKYNYIVVEAGSGSYHFVINSFGN